MENIWLFYNTYCLVTLRDAVRVEMVSQYYMYYTPNDKRAISYKHSQHTHKNTDDIQFSLSHGKWIKFHTKMVSIINFKMFTSLFDLYIIVFVIKM